MTDFESREVKFCSVNIPFIHEMSEVFQRNNHMKLVSILMPIWYDMVHVIYWPSHLHCIDVRSSWKLIRFIRSVSNQLSLVYYLIIDVHVSVAMALINTSRVLKKKKKNSMACLIESENTSSLATNIITWKEKAIKMFSSINERRILSPSTKPYKVSSLWE